MVAEGRTGGGAGVAGALARLRPKVAADTLAVLAAASLPWSTSATGILSVLWLVAVIPTLDIAAVRREILSPAGGLPVLFWLMGAIGMSWADVSLAERLDGWNAFHKFLAIPLLLAQFRRSGNGHWMIGGFLMSGIVLLLASYLHVLLWGRVSWETVGPPGVPVKDYITQSGTFEICIFGLAYAGLDAWGSGRRLIAAACAGLALLFLANITFVTTGRTALFAMPVLLVLLGLRRFGPRGVVAFAVAGAILAGVLWAASPYLRMRVDGIVNEISQYRAADALTSSGLRLEFWRKSLLITAEAPLIGHGTGTIHETFSRAAAASGGASAVASTNPHQQILAVAIQLGALGVVVLLAFWIGHLRLFLGPGLAAWCGLVVVVQNIISSLFNSHLFDFTQGWIYVFGVGVLGGMVRRAVDLECSPAGESSEFRIESKETPAAATFRRPQT